MGSLCGHEGFDVELAGLRKHVLKGRLGEIPQVLNKSMLLSEEQCSNLPYVALCLLGKFKGETRTNHHMIVVANKRVSGLRPRWWAEKLISVCESEGRTCGPKFANADGDLALSIDYNSMFRKYLLGSQMTILTDFQMLAAHCSSKKVSRQ